MPGPPPWPSPAITPPQMPPPLAPSTKKPSDYPGPQGHPILNTLHYLPLVPVAGGICPCICLPAGQSQSHLSVSGAVALSLFPRLGCAHHSPGRVFKSQDPDSLGRVGLKSSFLTTSRVTLMGLALGAERAGVSVRVPGPLVLSHGSFSQHLSPTRGPL